MRFITEDELRALYRKEPFETYSVADGTKLTPSARQFLTDRMVHFESATVHKTQHAETKQEDVSTEDTDCSQTRDWRLMKLFRGLEHTESLVLLVASDVSRFGNTRLGNAILAADILAVGKFIRNARKACQQQQEPEPILFWGCTDAELRHRADESGECEIDSECLRFCGDNGVTIVRLNYLRTAIRDLEPLVWEFQSQCQKPAAWCETLAHTLQCLADILCIIIGKCIGGKK